ncbi:MAG: outer membrane protein assembly factor BamB, partial [Alteromonas sp.]|nr:outer membrane protein assembly factor BamB [Alteromonas sp.]
DRDIGDGVNHYFSRLRPVYAYDKLYAADRHGLLSRISLTTNSQ